jgi:putative ABC transport system permease protein
VTPGDFNILRMSITEGETFAIRTLAMRADSVATRTFATQLLVGFSIVASILTLVGVYGAVSLSVAARRREIAVRSAIGAQSAHIRTLVFSDAFRLIAAGVVAGVIMAIVLSRARAVHEAR